MNKYELGVILRADLDDETFQAEMSRVKGLIERFEGTIDKVDEWGRRKLAYPINKLTEGVYTYIYFTSPAGAPREIEDRLNLMENVLRYLVIRQEDADTTAAKQPEPIVEEAVVVETVETPEEPAVADAE